MFNVTVIRLKDIIKYPIYIAIIMIAIYFTTKYFSNEYITYPIDVEMQLISQLENDSENLIDENEYDADTEFTTYLLSTALETQYGSVTNKEVISDEEEVSNIEEETAQEEENNELIIASKDVKTEVVTENAIKETYTDTYNGIKIKNETDYELTDDILNPEDLDIDSSNIIIFHTHTCESYTQSDEYTYKETGNYRTTDLNYSVARVGDELTKYLVNYNFNVTHDKTYHDYPSYSGSYTRSLSTVQNLLEEESADIIIDLHRDAIGSNSDYAPTVKIGDDYCAQIMFVMGTNRWWFVSSKLEFKFKICN